jgi:hypothetical protein
MTITRSAAELLARASSRERVTPADARSGAVFERIVVGQDRYFVKHLGAVPRGVVGFEVEFLGAYLPFSIAASSLSRSG